MVSVSGRKLDNPVNLENIEKCAQRFLWMGMFDTYVSRFRELLVNKGLVEWVVGCERPMLGHGPDRSAAASLLNHLTRSSPGKPIPSRCLCRDLE